MTCTASIRLARSNKSARVEGVAGTSTPTRGSVWLPVSGFEHDSEKVGVQVSTLASYSGCPQVDHLLVLKLADSGFRTPARVDLLLVSMQLSGTREAERKDV